MNNPFFKQIPISSHSKHSASSIQRFQRLGSKEQIQRNATQIFASNPLEVGGCIGVDQIMLSYRSKECCQLIHNGFSHGVKEVGRKRYDIIQDGSHFEYQVDLDIIVNKNTNEYVFVLYQHPSKNDDILKDFYFKSNRYSSPRPGQVICNLCENGIRLSRIFVVRLKISKRKKLRSAIILGTCT